MVSNFVSFKHGENKMQRLNEISWLFENWYILKNVEGGQKALSKSEESPFIGET